MRVRRLYTILKHKVFICNYFFSGWFYTHFRYLYPRYWVLLVIPTFRKFHKESSVGESINRTLTDLYLADQLLQYMSKRCLCRRDYKDKLKEEKKGFVYFS